ncbi:MAG: terpene cyclase/mutase family protein [Planctomycetes bacterium]|nr:terpene cyclase/mutase family protein [Planctomycetota bacterium]
MPPHPRHLLLAVLLAGAPLARAEFGPPEAPRAETSGLEAVGPGPAWFDDRTRGLPALGRAQDAAPTPLPTGAQAAVQEAIERGLDALAARQALLRDGSLPVSATMDASPLGVTALAALAWMAGGSTPTRGPHAGPLVRALEYLLAHQAGPGEAHPGWISASEDRQSRSHGHGLATLAFSQAAALSPRSPLGKRLGEGLTAAVRHIERMQGSEGGWYYGPGRTAEHEGSVTVCLVQALRGARNTGVGVDGEVIRRAIAYVETLQDETGGFRYSTTHPQVSVGLTAGCLATLHASGVYDGKVVDAGYDYVFRELAARAPRADGEPTGQPAAFPYYERLYLAQAFWQHRDLQHFRRWAEDEVRVILADQAADGTWEDRRPSGRAGGLTRGRYGDAYATAMNCLFLSVPEGLLPIFRR